jgi:hypothetical protein
MVDIDIIVPEEPPKGAFGIGISGTWNGQNVVVKLTKPLPANEHLQISRNRTYQGSLIDNFNHPATDALVAKSLGKYYRHDKSITSNDTLKGLCGVILSGPVHVFGTPNLQEYSYATVMPYVGRQLSEILKMPKNKVFRFDTTTDQSIVPVRVLIYALLHAVRLEYRMMSRLYVSHMDMHDGNILVNYADGAWTVSVIDLGLLSPTRPDAWSLDPLHAVIAHPGVASDFHSPAEVMYSDTLDSIMLMFDHITNYGGRQVAAVNHANLRKTKDTAGEPRRPMRDEIHACFTRCQGYITGYRKLRHYILYVNKKQDDEMWTFETDPGTNKTTKTETYYGTYADLQKKIDSATKDYNFGMFGIYSPIVGACQVTPANGSRDAYMKVLRRIEADLVALWNANCGKDGMPFRNNMSLTFKSRAHDDHAHPVPLDATEHCRLGVL